MRKRALSIGSDATTIDVAMTIRIPPIISLDDIGWFRNRTLNITAVTGSNAPKMAVGVDPMH